MEKFFIVRNQEYINEKSKVEEMKTTQIAFIKKFFKDKGIEGNTYILGGDGFINRPFADYEKGSVRLRIENTDSNMNKFSKELLSGVDQNGLVRFRKNSKTMKDLQQGCVDNKIIINIHEPRIGDYFKELRFGGYDIQEFTYQDTTYIMLNSAKIAENTKADGFEEIKGSEYHLALESLRESEDGK